MKKSFALAAAGKHPDRVLDAVKHDIRKYLRRERRRELPEGVDFLDFDCRFGRDADNAQTVHLSALTGLVDAAARDGATQVYVEILAKPGHRTQRPSSNETLPDAALPASGDDSTKTDGDGDGDGNGNAMAMAMPMPMAMPMATVRGPIRSPYGATEPTNGG